MHFIISTRQKKALPRQNVSVVVSKGNTSRNCFLFIFNFFSVYFSKSTHPHQSPSPFFTKMSHFILLKVSIFQICAHYLIKTLMADMPENPLRRSFFHLTISLTIVMVLRNTKLPICLVVGCRCGRLQWPEVLFLFFLVPFSPIFYGRRKVSSPSTKAIPQQSIYSISFGVSSCTTSTRQSFYFVTTKEHKLRHIFLEQSGFSLCDNFSSFWLFHFRKVLLFCFRDDDFALFFNRQSILFVIPITDPIIISPI